MSKVIKIGAVARLPKQDTVPKVQRVAAYVRVSTDFEEQLDSLAAQEDYYEKKIGEHADWSRAGIYADGGRSGTSYVHREGFNRMIADCEAGKIDMVITKSISRFARNTVDALIYIRKLKLLGIGVYFEREDIWTLDSKGEFLITLLTSLAQEESRSISKNTAWGIRKRFADGKYSVAYSTFLGYDRGTEKGQFVINQGQAAVVRLIYRMYPQGYSAYMIAKFLSRWEIHTPAGKHLWSESVVRSILVNEKYKGDALLQKNFTVDFLTKKRKKNEGELKQHYVEDGHDAIIERQAFDYVQERKAGREQAAECRSGVDLYSSLFTCGICGCWYGAKVEHSNDKYRRVMMMCRRRFKAPYYCKNARIDKEDIPKLFIEAVRRLCIKYPAIKRTCIAVMEEAGVRAGLQVKNSYIHDMQDLTMIVDSAIVYPDKTVKIELIDSTKMKLRL